jgi:hypothetical protein
VCRCPRSAGRPGGSTPSHSIPPSCGAASWATRERAIDYPIAVDNDYEIWSAFANHYWPEPASDGVQPELTVDIESREHLTWAADQAATMYRHDDESPEVCMPTTAEGSSRMTGVCRVDRCSHVVQCVLKRPTRACAPI